MHHNVELECQTNQPLSNSSVESAVVSNLTAAYDDVVLPQTQVTLQ